VLVGDGGSHAPHITAAALRFGTASVGLHAAWQLALYFSPIHGPESMSPDLAASAEVWAFTALTRGCRERLMADDHLADLESGRNGLHGKVAWVMVPVLALAFPFESVSTQQGGRTPRVSGSRVVGSGAGIGTSVCAWLRSSRGPCTPHARRRPVAPRSG